MSWPGEAGRAIKSADWHYVERAGAGPPLLFLHGVARHGGDWRQVLPQLATGRRAIALDFPGHGGSSRAPGKYLVVHYARAAAEFLQEHCRERAIVIGHSLGAMVALWLAAECGPRVAAVILEDPPFQAMGRRIAGTPYIPLFAGLQAVARGGGGLEMMTNSLAAIELPTPGGIVRLGALRDRADLQFMATCLQVVDPAVFDPLLAGRWLEGYQPEALWPRVACPALLLQGDPAAGGTLSDEDVAQALALLPRGQCERFAGAGHQLHGTRPAEFCAAVQRFLQALM